MSTRSRAEARGAGPSTATRLEPVVHDAWKPDPCSVSTALRTRIGSGPNSAAYTSGVTVFPDAISAARRPGSRTLSTKLSDTVVDSPAGPRRSACRMAVARVGGGEETGRVAVLSG